MDTDDQRIGRTLSRREALALLGAFGAGVAGLSLARATFAQATAPMCVVRPELTEGPYFVDAQLNRSDIRTEPSDGSVKPGLPLTVAFQIMQVGGGGCSGLSGAQVDIWHCDALGIYSGVNDPSFGASTVGQMFLRGYQLTDARGNAGFTSIYPGWYSGRAVHIHFKIRTTTTTGDAYEFTSQFFFDDALTDQVHAQPPYNSKGQRDTRNDVDMIFNGGGDQWLMAATPSGDRYTVSLPIALDLSDVAVGAPDSAATIGGPGGPPPGGLPGGPGGPPQGAPGGGAPVQLP